MPRFRSLYIFDLDGTITTLQPARLALLNGTYDPKRWDRFYAACVTDRPNHPVIHIAQSLSRYADIWFWSGRSDVVWDQTCEWLQDYCFGIFKPKNLRMRRAGDYTEDHKLKERWLLEETLDVDRQRLEATFDDRNQVVAMWRRNGVPCFQVKDGDY